MAAWRMPCNVAPKDLLTHVDGNIVLGNQVAAEPPVSNVQIESYAFFYEPTAVIINRSAEHFKALSVLQKVQWTRLKFKCDAKAVRIHTFSCAASRHCDSRFKTRVMSEVRSRVLTLNRLAPSLFATLN